MDDHGIYIGDIKARLDDGRRNKNVDSSIDKVVHDTLKLRLFHLSVSKSNVRFGHKFLNSCRNIRYVVYSVVHVINLAVSSKFSHYRFSHKLVVVFHNISLDWKPVVRRFFKDRHLSDSDK